MHVRSRELTPLVSLSGEPNEYRNNGPVPFLPRLSYKTRIWAQIASPGTILIGLVALIAHIAGCSLLQITLISGSLWLLSYGAKTWLAGGDSLRPAVFISLEEVSSGLDISGGIMSLTIPPVLRALKNMEGSRNSQRAAACLENLLLYVQNFDYTGLWNGGLVEYQQKMIRRLQPGDVIALPCSWFAPSPGIGHIMVFEVTCTGDEEYRVRVFNGGDGSGPHAKHDGKDQSFYEIENIDLESMVNIVPHLARLHTFRPGNNSAKLYKKILPLLEGNKSEKDLDPRLWTNGQTGQSCSGFSINLFLKAMLSEDEYREFEECFCAEMGQRLEAGLKSRVRIWEQTSVHEFVMKAMKYKQQALRNRTNPHGFCHDPALPKSSKLGKVALWGQQFFWDMIFFVSPGKRRNLEEKIRTYYFYVALEHEKSKANALKWLEAGIDFSYKGFGVQKALEMGDLELAEIILHSHPNPGTINEFNIADTVFAAFKLGNIAFAEKIYNSSPLSESSKRDIVLKAISANQLNFAKRVYEELKEDLCLALFEAINTKDPMSVKEVLTWGEISDWHEGVAIFKALALWDVESVVEIFYSEFFRGKMAKVRGEILWKALDMKREPLEDSETLKNLFAAAAIHDEDEQRKIADKLSQLQKIVDEAKESKKKQVQ